MQSSFKQKAVIGALAAVLLVGVAVAQGPGRGAPPPGAFASSAVAAPTYLIIPLEIMVNKPAAEVWKRVGKYCDIAEWLRVPCTITSGKDGEVGTVRSIGSEILVGKTELSYTYTQPVQTGQPYNLYHGTLEARPVTATTTKIVYTLIYDNSMAADDAAREREKTQKTAQFQGAIENMKILAEGGTLPARLRPAVGVVRVALVRAALEVQEAPAAHRVVRVAPEVLVVLVVALRVASK